MRQRRVRGRGRGERGGPRLLAYRRAVPGGDLEVERRDDGEVLLTGEARRVFEGVADLEALVGS